MLRKKKSVSNLSFTNIFIRFFCRPSQENTTSDQILFARSNGSDEVKFSVILAEKLWDFFRGRSLKYKILKNVDFTLASSEQNELNLGISLNLPEVYEEARGKLKNSGHLVGLVVAKAALIGILIFKGIVLLVGKALLVSKLAFLLSSLIALKKLLSKKYVTYEVVAHPSHENHLTDNFGGWGRTFDNFLETLV